LGEKNVEGEKKGNKGEKEDEREKRGTNQKEEKFEKI